MAAPPLATRKHHRPPPSLGTRGGLTATTKPQLATGPQKCVVVGPTGERIHALNLDITERES